MRHATLPALALILLAAALTPTRAWAQRVCMSPSEFNEFAARTGNAATAGTLTMRFASRDMNTIPGEKSVLVDFVDTRRMASPLSLRDARVVMLTPPGCQPSR